MAQEGLVEPRKCSSHNADLAAAIAGAWIDLPDTVRAKGWPQWLPEHQGKNVSSPSSEADMASLGFAPGFEWMATGF